MNHGAHGEHRELGGTARSELILDDLTRAIIDAGLKVHKALGPGLLEATYERRLEREFSLRGIAYKRQSIRFWSPATASIWLSKMPLSLQSKPSRRSHGYIAHSF